MNTNFCPVIYVNAKKYVKRCTSRTVFWNQNYIGNDLSFVGIQLYSDIAVTSLIATAVVAYPPHLAFFNFTYEFRHYFIAYEYIVFDGFLYQQLALIKTSQSKDGFTESQFSEVDLRNRFPASMERDARTGKLEVLYKSVRSNILSLNEFVQSGFSLTLCGKTWKCHPAVILYCCDISERKACLEWIMVQQCIRAFDIWHQRIISVPLNSVLFDQVTKWMKYSNHIRNITVNTIFLLKTVRDVKRDQAGWVCITFWLLHFEQKWSSTFSATANKLLMGQRSIFCDHRFNLNNFCS